MLKINQKCSSKWTKPIVCATWIKLWKMNKKKKNENNHIHTRRTVVSNKKENDEMLSAVWFSFHMKTARCCSVSCTHARILSDKSCFIATDSCETEDKGVEHMCLKLRKIFHISHSHEIPMNINTTCLMWNQFFSRLFIPFLCFPLCVGAQEFCCPYSLFSGCEYFCSRGMASEEPSACHNPVCTACFLGHEFLKMCQQKPHSCFPGPCSPLDCSASHVLYLWSRP